MKPKNIKIEICNALNGRRKKERAIIGLFFEERNGRFYPGRFKNMYNIIVKNLKTMNDERLDIVYHSVCDTQNKLKNDSSKDIASMLKRQAIINGKN